MTRSTRSSVRALADLTASAVGSTSVSDWDHTEFKFSSSSSSSQVSNFEVSC